MKKGVFQRECENIARQVAKKRMLSKGWKGEAPQEIVKVFEDILMSLFEDYFFHKRVYEALVGKEHEISNLATGLEIDLRMLSLETRIEKVIESYHERWLGIENCLHRVIGVDSGYFIQQVKMSKYQLKEIDKRVSEEVRMILGNRLDDLLSLRK